MYVCAYSCLHQKKQTRSKGKICVDGGKRHQIREGPTFQPHFEEGQHNAATGNIRDVMYKNANPEPKV